MKRFIAYDLSTGEIVGRYSLSPGQETAYKNLIAVTDEIYDAIPEQSKRVNRNTKRVINKNKVTATVSKSTFTANGIDSTTITFATLSGATHVLINNADRGTIDPASPTVTITSDMPMTFAVKIKSLLDYSDTITVTAQ